MTGNDRYPEGVDPEKVRTEGYDGAGDGQCFAIKDSDGERCTNGVYGSDRLCGLHKRSSDVRTVEDAVCAFCGYLPEHHGGGARGCPSTDGGQPSTGSERALLFTHEHLIIFFGILGMVLGTIVLLAWAFETLQSSELLPIWVMLP